ncbi:ABC transporter [Setomelanomma holmii]|uniref:ABC transporter n=1 Tax=Setomelanomma holmii TaxID=210430 RepID=A0A9P4HD06_9PLEO|nr:ABC transporter [Setomelanomma holmii]
MHKLSTSYDTLIAFDGASIIENRTIDQVYRAALNEGGIVTCWHGGDEKDQQAFETRFPGMTLNITVDVSKYHDGNIDRQLATDSLYVDSIVLQTLHDYPRWDQEGALLHYQPANFYKVHPAFRDIRAAWYGISVVAWEIIWNSNKIANGPKDFTDFLKTEFKDKIVLTYPNDDDAVLYAFDLIMQQYGYSWFEALLTQNPRWVRGTATPVTLLSTANSTSAVTFTSGLGLSATAPLNFTLPSQGTFVSWAQRAAIFRDVPHPEGAKLLHNFLLSYEHQNSTSSWSVLKDVPAPNGFPGIMDVSSTNPVEFDRFMGDRVRVERLKLWFEDKIGTPQGLSPLIDDL